VMPESGVDHMSCNVLHTTVVPVNGEPVLQLLGIGKSLFIVRIDVTKKLPG